MDNEEATMRRRFEELAPWHVNGTLSESDRRWVDDYVRTHPRASAQLDWYASLQERVKADAPQIEPDLGLERLLHRVRNEIRREPAKPQSWLDRLFAPIRGGAAALTLRPVYAYAGAALLVLQAGVIGTLVVEQHAAEQEFAQFRSMATVPVSGPVLRVTFRADARESDIRLALLAVGGNIVGGPGHFGQYIVSVPGEHIARAVETLRANTAVEALDVAEAPPAIR
jgi:hypothetical protein